MPPTADFTRRLRERDADGPEANALAFRLAYDELRRLAHAQLRHERPGHTLNPTGLVHQAFLRLVGQSHVTWQSRQHFLCVAAEAMRRILVNHARDRKAQKRGGGAAHLSLEEAFGLGHAAPEAFVLALDEALTHLGRLDERKRQVVELRYFAGLTEEEAAEALGVSRTTVQREWRTARAWLYRWLKVEG